jgi:two-component system alkaline phosphatase synthesis response regulator PhoP
MNDRKIRMLVVDDEPDMLILMKRALQKDGYDVDTCQNGENIDTVIQENPPDIILMDIKMDNVDGGDICKMIKDDPTTQHIRIVLFSSNYNVQTIAKECGADASLSKPYNSILARKTFQRVLN